MNQIPHDILSDNTGQPKAVLVPWEVFQKVQNALNGIKGFSLDDTEEKEGAESPAPPQHVEGGDYKTLRDIGVSLPKVRKRPSQAVTPETENPLDTKRITPNSI